MPGSVDAARPRDGRRAAARGRPVAADLAADLPPGRHGRARRGADHRPDRRRRASAGYVINIRDVTERLQFEDRLSHQAFHDLTTGLANRALFCSRTVHALERHDAGRGARRRAVPRPRRLQGDQRRLGYVAGDQLLAAVGARLARIDRARPTRSLASAATSSRSCSRHPPDGDAVATACRVHDLLEQPFAFDGTRGVRAREHRHRVRRALDLGRARRRAAAAQRRRRDVHRQGRRARRSGASSRPRCTRPCSTASS